MKQNRDREFRRHVVEGFDDVSRALSIMLAARNAGLAHVVGLRRSILDVKVGHDSHLRADDGYHFRSTPISRQFQSPSALRKSAINDIAVRM